MAMVLSQTDYGLPEMLMEKFRRYDSDADVILILASSLRCSGKRCSGKRQRRYMAIILLV